MCVVFIDLKKVSPKDDFPLPRIDQLVDATFGCGLMSFLDAYSGYHKVFMAKEDEGKTAFITLIGTYCFIRMPFGLKNVGATFTRLIAKVLPLPTSGQKGQISTPRSTPSVLEQASSCGYSFPNEA